MQKLKTTRRKQNKQQKETEQTTFKQTLRKQQNKNRNTEYPAHEPPRIICAIYSRRFVGWISYIYVFCFKCFSLSFSVCFMFISCLMFSPSLFKLLHLQSTNTHITTEATHKHTIRRKTEQQTKT